MDIVRQLQSNKHRVMRLVLSGFSLNIFYLHSSLQPRYSQDVK